MKSDKHGFNSLISILKVHRQKNFELAKISSLKMAGIQEIYKNIPCKQKVNGFSNFPVIRATIRFFSRI